MLGTRSLDSNVYFASFKQVQKYYLSEFQNLVVWVEGEQVDHLTTQRLYVFVTVTNHVSDLLQIHCTGNRSAHTTHKLYLRRSRWYFPDWRCCELKIVFTRKWKSVWSILEKRLHRSGGEDAAVKITLAMLFPGMEKVSIKNEQFNVVSIVALSRKLQLTFTGS